MADGSPPRIRSVYRRPRGLCAIIARPLHPASMSIFQLMDFAPTSAVVRAAIALQQLSDIGQIVAGVTSLFIFLTVGSYARR
jgi:hypothetical protein